MPRHTVLLLAVATLSATAAVSLAQTAYPAGPNDSPQTTQSQPAPISRGAVNPNGDISYTTPLVAGQVLAPGRGIASAQAASGIFVRVGHNSSVRAVTATAENTELKIERGVANISLHNPVNHAQILVDLPGGQTSLIKDGFYTFNASTNTVRVLKGEAFAYPGANTTAKPIKVKENHAVIFGGSASKAFEFDPFEARADLIPYAQRGGPGEPGGTSNYYGYGPYGLAYGGDYPYYGYYGYGYPYGYYPFGLGFYGGGFYGRGFGGGFRGGGRR